MLGCLREFGPSILVSLEYGSGLVKTIGLFCAARPSYVKALWDEQQLVDKERP